VPIVANTVTLKSPPSNAIEPARHGSVQSNEAPVPAAQPQSLPLAASKSAASIASEGHYRSNRQMDPSPRAANHSAATAVTGRSFSQPAKPPAQSDGGIEIIAPPGAQLPIALLQASDGTNSETELNPVQQRLADKLAEDFVQEVASTGAAEEPGSANSEESNTEALNRWRHAAAGADERFRALLGYDIYNREIIRQHQVNNQTLPKH
jgi:hypothetical protein